MSFHPQLRLQRLSERCILIQCPGDIDGKTIHYLGFSVKEHWNIDGYVDHPEEDEEGEEKILGFQ